MHRLGYILNTDVVKTSGPGYPLCVTYATNGDAIAEISSRLVRIATMRLALLATCDCLNAVELVMDGVVDPVKLFIKDEPHSLKKISQGMWRLISSVSLVDQLVARFLHSPLNRWEILHFREIPSQPGMGIEDSDFERMQDWFDGQPIISTDVSGWDWSVKEWLMEADMRMRVRLCNLQSDDIIAKLMYGRLHATKYKLFVTSNRKLFAQVVPGIQPSGDFNTSSSNSRMMAFVLTLCGAHWIKTMGDDAVSKGTSQPQLSRLVDVKVFTESTTEFEFCSHVVTPSSVSCCGWAKSAFRYLDTIHRLVGDKRQVYTDAFLHVMRNDRERAQLVLSVTSG